MVAVVIVTSFSLMINCMLLYLLIDIHKSKIVIDPGIRPSSRNRFPGAPQLMDPAPINLHIQT